MPRVMQGDVLTQDDQLLIVFGHLGFNEMRVKWEEFVANRVSPSRLLPFQDEHEPVDPVEFVPGRFVVTVVSHQGMEDAAVEATLGRWMAWANQNGLKSVATNGVAHATREDAHDKAADDDRRVRWLIDLTRSYEGRYGLMVTLISLNDVFARNAALLYEEGE